MLHVVSIALLLKYEYVILLSVYTSFNDVGLCVDLLKKNHMCFTFLLLDVSICLHLMDSCLAIYYWHVD